MSQAGVTLRIIALLLAALYLSAACSTYQNQARHSGGSPQTIEPSFPEPANVAPEANSGSVPAASASKDINTTPPAESSADDPFAPLYAPLNECDRSDASRSECERLTVSLAKLEKICKGDVL